MRFFRVKHFDFCDYEHIFLILIKINYNEDFIKTNQFFGFNFFDTFLDSERN